VHAWVRDVLLPNATACLAQRMGQCAVTARPMYFCGGTGRRCC